MIGRELNANAGRRVFRWLDLGALHLLYFRDNSFPEVGLNKNVHGVSNSIYLAER